MSRNPLQEWFERTEGRGVHKWMHYFDVYHRHFQRFRGKRITLVEFGISIGGSVQMWHEYFGSRLKMYGVDIDPRCANFATDWFTVYIGDQADRTFLRKIAKKIGPIDILIDDGGHHFDQQIATFEELYPQVKPGGVYLIEDLHTSYYPRYGGGKQVPGTFIEYAKPLIDQLNAFHSREPGFQPDEFTRTTRSMHVYDSIIVLEKGTVSPPYHQRRGHIDWDRPDLHQLDLSPQSRLRSAATAAGERLSARSRSVERRLRKLWSGSRRG
jgi:cephalosporin hydroxylase